jgi:hydrogenase/urease accessory protein HupE
LLSGLWTQIGLAHNPDTSYVRVELSEDWVRTKFTFDLSVLSQVVPLDQNGDGEIAFAEFDRGIPQIRKLLRESVQFEINEYADDFGEFDPPIWPAETASVSYADLGTTLVHFPFSKRVQELPESVTLVFGFFDRLGDRHTVLGTFVQPSQPDYEVIFRWDEPDFLFFTEYDAPPQDRMLEFLWLGVEHILLGYDHILFLLALIVVDRFSTLLKIITSFTVAHTITLILATLEIVSIPPRLVESAIAATIVYVAIENLASKKTNHRWLLTFFFGLVHGFGFANVLRELNLPTAGMVRCLLSFNVGVELGQIALVAPIWPLWKWVSRTRAGDKVKAVLSILIGLCGLAWLLDRVFALGLMPF